MNYQEAMKYIGEVHKYGSKLGLENIKQLLELLGNPHKELKIIHVAGTNGKGSTAAYIREMLAENGYSVGFYTSPYLEVFNERIQVNHSLIKDEEIAEHITEIESCIKIMLEKGYNHPTEFEVITAMAFLYFKKKNVDYVVLEVGLGGRFDATNVIESSLISVITSISYDHTKILGDTLTKIAFEKSGIIKENGLIVSYPQVQEAEVEIIKNARLKHAQYYSVNHDDISIVSQNEKSSVFKLIDIDENIEISMLGVHQIYNAALAIKALKILEAKHLVSLDRSKMIGAIKNTHWNGRMEVISENPLIIIDGAHNPDGAKSLMDTLNITFSKYEKILCIGMLEDKDVDEVLKKLIPYIDNIIVTEPNSDRALTAEKMAEKIEKYGKKVEVRTDREAAFNLLLEKTKEQNQLGIIAGSLYLIGEGRKWLKKVSN